MKYLKIFEEFDSWEKITADQWYSTFHFKNQPFDETEYEKFPLTIGVPLIVNTPAA